MATRTVLWHLDVSHYNEKVRWALDVKRVPHARRAVLPGPHVAVARLLAGATTLPVLVLDGRAIADSTRIIAALEERFPAPPLYPADPALRRRALELEELLDTELGPAVRRAFLFEVFADPELTVTTADRRAGRGRRRLLRAALPGVVPGLARRYRVNRASAADGLARTRASLDRIAAELGPTGYLVGDRFTVADLTAASLGRVFAPLRFLHPVIGATPSVRAARAELRDHPAVRYIADMHVRHRGAGDARPR